MCHGGAIKEISAMQARKSMKARITTFLSNDTSTERRDSARTGLNVQQSIESKADRETMAKKRRETMALELAKEQAELDAQGNGEIVDAKKLKLQLPVVQFSIAIYFAEKDEGTMKIDICKLGNPFADCSCTYQTNPSVYEGIKYEPITGTCEFKSGEATQSIHVPIKWTDGFDSSREFTISLAEPKGCTLGLYLRTCRVKIVERSVFPTSRFEEKTRKDHTGASWSRGNSFAMLRETRVTSPRRIRTLRTTDCSDTPRTCTLFSLST
jgi:hypothetical protein